VCGRLGYGAIESDNGAVSKTGAFAEGGWSYERSA